MILKIVLAAILLPLSFAASSKYSDQVKIVTAANFESNVIKNEVNYFKNNNKCHL